MTDSDRTDGKLTPTDEELPEAERIKVFCANTPLGLEDNDILQELGG